MPDADPLLVRHAADLKAVRGVSTRSYALYHELLSQQSLRPPREYADVVRQSVAVAQSTSAAITHLIDQRHHLPALVLTRIRFEQAVVLSYLIHESPDAGLKPYSRFAPIAEYRVAEAVRSERFLSPHVPSVLDYQALKTRAVDAQLEINPGFDLQAGTFQRKWTNLDAYSMALRRDALAARSNWIVSTHLPLAPLYVALYQTASSPVHSDGSMLVPPLGGVIIGADGTKVDASTFWALALPPYLATYDLLQCYEALHWDGVNCDELFLELSQAMVT